MLRTPVSTTKVHLTERSSHEKMAATHFSRRDGRVVFEHVAAAEREGFSLQRIRTVAHCVQWPFPAHGLARAQFAPANPREAECEPRTVERRVRQAEDHSRHRM